MKLNKGIINNWQFVQFHGDCIVVVGDWNGKHIRTSYLVGIYGTTVETRNSYYTLGTPLFSHTNILETLQSLHEGEK